MQPPVRDAWILAVGFGLLYAVGAATTVQGGDAGEFMAIAARGGVAHPPGYPLYTALSRLLVALVPFGALAWKASLASAVLGGATVGVLHRAVSLATESRTSALVGAVAMGVSPLFWKWSGVAEVLSGAVLTAALLLLVAVGSSVGRRGPRQAALLGAAFATGVANHHTAILLLPLIAYAGLVALPRPLQVGSALRTLGAFVATTLALGLTPYLLLTLDGGAWRWGDTGTLDGLVHHFLRADYGTFTASERSEGSGPWSQVALLLGQTPTRFPGVLWLLAPLGLWELRERRGFLLAACGSWLLAGPLFLTRFDLPTHGYTRVVIERFHSVPDVIVAFLVGAGAAAVIAHPRWSRPTLPAGILALNLLVAAAIAGPQAHWRGWTVLDDYLHNAVRWIEPDALVLAHGDSMFFGGVFTQEALGRAPGVAWVNPSLLGYPWYRAALSAKHPDLVLTGPSGKGLAPAALVAANAGRRATYIAPRALLKTQGFAEALTLPAYPYRSVLMRVATPTTLPPPDAVDAEMRAALERLQWRSTLDEDHLDHELEAGVWENYALTWSALASAWEAGGRPARAEAARDIGRRMAPWLLSPPGSPGAPTGSAGAPSPDAGPPGAD